MFLIQKKKKLKQKKLKKKDNISAKLIKKNKFAAARLKIFLVTRISGNKSIFLALLISFFDDTESK